MQKKIYSNTLLAIMACLLWSTAFVGIKTGLKYTTPLQFAGIRFFLAGVILMPLAGSLKKYFTEVSKHIRLILAVSTFQTFVLYALFYKGIELIPGSLTAIIIGSQPLFVALIAHFTISNDKMGLRKTLTISSGISGIVLIAAPKGLSGPDGISQLIGMGLLVLSNMASGIGNVIVSKKKSNLSPIILNSAQMMLGGLALFLISLFFEPIILNNFPLEYYLALGWLSFISAAAFSFWFMLLQKPEVKVSELNIYKFIIPVFGAILSWIILPNEQPDWLSVIGMLIIAGSVIVSGIQSRKQFKK